MVFVLNEVMFISLISLLSRCVRLVFWRAICPSLKMSNQWQKTLLLKPPPFIEKIEIVPPVVHGVKLSSGLDNSEMQRIVLVTYRYGTSQHNTRFKVVEAGIDTDAYPFPFAFEPFSDY